MNSIITGIQLFYLIALLNILFIIVGFSQIGRGFALRTSMAIVELGAVVAFTRFTAFAADKLLLSIFGGFF